MAESDMADTFFFHFPAVFFQKVISKKRYIFPPFPEWRNFYNIDTKSVIQVLSEISFFNFFNYVKIRGNVSLSAKSAGVTRQNLTYLLKKYNIDPKSFRWW